MRYRSIVVLSAILLSTTSFAQDWAKFNRYEKANAEVTVKPHAVLMGDSITDFWVRDDAEFFTENNLIGRGISGQTTSQMLVRFRKDVIDLSPKYVVILAGTNDIAKNNGDITLDNILGNLMSMCELAKANGIKPVLCSILPAAAYRWRPEVKPAQEIIKLNEMIRKYAKENKIPYVDYHSALADEQGGLPEQYAADGVHPNPYCYEVMEKIILEYL